jgi:hypothetical protein
MSDEYSKAKKAKRIQADERAIQRQVRIAKSAGVVVEEPHKYAKHHALDCGNPGCCLCGNPRKVFKEKTIQEKRFDQSTFEEV